MKHLSAILIILFLAAACNSPQTEQTNTDKIESTEKIASVEIIIINISGMHCEGCEKTITDALTALEGAKGVRVSFIEEQAKVKYDPSMVGIEEFKAAIEGAGYGVSAYEIMPMENKIIEEVE